MGSAVFSTVLVRHKIYCSNRSQTPYLDHECERSGIQIAKMENSWKNDYKILFKKGIFNTNADALSRVGELVADKGVTGKTTTGH